MFVKRNLFASTSLLTTIAAIGVYSKKTNSSSEAESSFKVPFFRAAVANNPKFDKRYKAGEDAWLVSEDSKMLVVCDGVGGWGELDVCSGKFARFLVKKINELYNNSLDKTVVGLKDLLDESVKQNPNKGSTTCVMTRLNDNKQMETCNLGDSAYLWLRPSNKHSFGLETMYKSKVQQYEFNFPYQCGTYCDLPTKADVVTHDDVRHGDIVVVGSDGLFDNTFDEQIKQCFKLQSNPASKQQQNHVVSLTDQQLKQATDCIATWTEFLSYQKEWHSPWTTGAIEHGRKKEKELGGKKDDITVIVAQVKQQ